MPLKSPACLSIQSVAVVRGGHYPNTDTDVELMALDRARRPQWLNQALDKRRRIRCFSRLFRCLPRMKLGQIALIGISGGCNFACLVESQNTLRCFSVEALELFFNMIEVPN